MSNQKELELTDEMLQRNDDIDNAVFNCILTLVEDPSMEWNMEIIGNVTDAIKSELGMFGLTVRHPGVVTDSDGKQRYED